MDKVVKEYRKKPVVIKAIQWTGNNLIKVQSFIEGKEIDLKNKVTNDKWDDYTNMVYNEGLKIHTLEGSMNADVGDFIIKGVKGEFYPCKPDIFEKTYEPVT